MKGHYVMLVFAVGKTEVRREYVEIEPDETAEQGIARWIAEHPTMIDRQRNRERQARALEGSILEHRIARPTSWHREQALAAGLPWPTPPSRRTRRGRAGA